MSCLTFLAMAALVATVAAAAGSVSRLTINPVTKVVREGQDTELHFTLTKPIHCPEAYLHDCKVLLLLTNTRTDEIALSACHVEWDYSEWETTKIGAPHLLHAPHTHQHIRTQVPPSRPSSPNPCVRIPLHATSLPTYIQGLQAAPMPLPALSAHHTSLTLTAIVLQFTCAALRILWMTGRRSS